MTESTVRSLEELAELVGVRDDLYVRWSRGPAVDLAVTASSLDELTGVAMPGLCASPLRVETWWEGRSLCLWVARRLYDYSHLRQVRGCGVRPWLMAAREVARGPDNEPLVADVEPLGWIDEKVIVEAEEELARQRTPWGPLRRPCGP